MIEELNHILQSTENIIIYLYQNNLHAAYELLHAVHSPINQAMLKFIQSVPAFKSKGIDIPHDVLIMQMKNYLEAYERADTLLLADTLKYEICQAFLYYKEIIKTTE